MITPIPLPQPQQPGANHPNKILADKEKRFYNSYAEFAEEQVPHNKRNLFPDAETAGKWLIENNPDVFSHVKIVPGYADVAFAHGMSIDKLGGQVKEGLSALGEVFTTRPDRTLGGMAKAGLGAFDHMFTPSDDQIASEVDRMVQEGIPREEAERIVPSGPELTAPETREAGGDMMSTARRNLSPAGFSEDFYRGIATLSPLLPQGGSLKAASMASKLKNYPKAQQAIRATGHVRDIIDPTTLPFKAIEGLGSGVSSLAEKAQPHLKGALRKGRDKAGSITKDVKRDDASLGKETLSAILGFTTSIGSRGIEALIDGFGTKLINNKNFDDVFKESRNMRREAGTKDLLRTGYDMADTWNQKLKDFYKVATEKAFKGDGGTKRSRMIETGAMEEHILSILDEFGFKYELVTPIGAGGKTLKPRWKVTPEEKRSSITHLGADRQIVRQAAEKFLNMTLETKSGQPGRINAFDLHQQRIGLDDSISKIAHDGASGRTKVAMGQFRDVVSKHLEASLGDEYIIAMLEYSDGRRALDLVDQYLGLRPGMIKDGKFGVLDDDGFLTYSSRTISDLGEMDFSRYEDTLNKLANVFSDSPEQALRGEILSRLQQEAGSDLLAPKLLGRMSSPIFGSGLVVKSEISQSLRHIVGIIGAAEIGGAAAMGAPAFILFSPRLATQALMRGAASIKDKSMLSGFMRSLQKLKKIDEGTNLKLSDMVKRTGWSIAQLIERLEAQTGEDLAEGAGFGDDPRKAAPAALSDAIGLLGMNPLFSGGSASNPQVTE